MTLRLAAAVLGLAAVSCDGEPGEPDDEGSVAEMPVPLVDPTQWAIADASADLFAHMRPPDVVCDEDRGYYLYETPWATLLEINTGWCNYLTAAQPLLEPLEVGDVVEVRVYHFDLAGGPAEGYVGVGIGDEIEWEATVAIPSPSGIVKGTFEVASPVEAGTPIQFHVHNHGSNTWELYSIDRISSGS
jgi:hypothetical protein